MNQFALQSEAFESNAEYSRVAFAVVNDDVNINDLYDVHNCYCEDCYSEEGDPVQAPEAAAA
jgi:hypothetical protein